MNELFVEVINSAAVRPNTELVINGLRLNVEEWRKFNFFPNNGVIGQIMGEAQTREGIIYLVQFDDQIMAAVLPKGLRQISKFEAIERYPRNRIIGRFDESQYSASMADEMFSGMNDIFK